jgi:hypothetical protein
MRSAFKMMVGNTQGMGLRGRPRHSWENNIKKALKEIECCEKIMDLKFGVSWPTK